MTTPTHAQIARLGAARRTFAAKLEGLSPAVRRLRLKAMIARQPGVGEGMTDPMEQALARQTLEAMDLADRINAAADEHGRLIAEGDDRHVPGDPDYQRNRRARINELEGQARSDREALDRVHRGSTGAFMIGQGQDAALAAYAAADEEAAIVAEARQRAEVDKREERVASLVPLIAAARGVNINDPAGAQ
jgi:hypothetical protein